MDRDVQSCTQIFYLSVFLNLSLPLPFPTPNPKLSFYSSNTQLSHLSYDKFSTCKRQLSSTLEIVAADEGTLSSRAVVKVSGGCVMLLSTSKGHLSRATGIVGTAVTSSSLVILHREEALREMNTYVYVKVFRCCFFFVIVVVDVIAFVVVLQTVHSVSYTHLTLPTRRTV